MSPTSYQLLYPAGCKSTKPRAKRQLTERRARNTCKTLQKQADDP